MAIEKIVIDNALRFNCCECGTPIIRVVDTGEGPICATCIHLPRWFDNPVLCKTLDPTNLRNPPPHERE